MGHLSSACDMLQHSWSAPQATSTVSSLLAAQTAPHYRGCAPVRARYNEPEPELPSHVGLAQNKFYGQQYCACTGHTVFSSQIPGHLACVFWQTINFQTVD